MGRGSREHVEYQMVFSIMPPGGETRILKLMIVSHHTIYYSYMYNNYILTAVGCLR